jgi:hypothetical protein
MSNEEVSRYERADISARAVFWFFLSLALSLLVIGGSIAAFATAMSHRSISSLRTADPAMKPSFPSPQLQTLPATDLAKYLEAQKRDLESYGWIDRKAGVIHVPIERAIDLTLERGLPARAANAGGKP